MIYPSEREIQAGRLLPSMRYNRVTGGTAVSWPPDILANPERCDMTTVRTTRGRGGFRLPDPPPREPDDMTSFNHLTRTGGAYLLAEHLGSPETTLVAGEHYITPVPTGDMTGVKYPDLLIAFDVDPEAYRSSNAYVISEQGKPPDFVLEIASRGTWREDVGEKREVYAEFGIPEYWRFDETGEFYGERLAGERLVRGSYEPIEVERVSEDTWQGHSEVLGLDIRWSSGQLEWRDPSTGQRIVTLDDERAARIQAESQVEVSEARAETAEERVREIEEELRRLRGE